MELCADKILLYVVNIHQCNLFTICSFFSNLFTVTGNNYIMHSKDRIGNRKFIPNYQLSFFKVTQLA